MTQSGQSPGGTAWEKVPFDNHRLNFSCRPAGAQHHIPHRYPLLAERLQTCRPAGAQALQSESGERFGRMENREWKPRRIASRLAKSFHRRIVHC